MTRILVLSLALAGAMSLSACQTTQQTGALAGGAIGAGTGALIGSATFWQQRRRRHRGRRDRRRHGRADRQRRDASAPPPLRAVGFRPTRQPGLRGFLPLTKPHAAPH